MPFAEFPWVAAWTLRWFFRRGFTRMNADKSGWKMAWKKRGALGPDIRSLGLYLLGNPPLSAFIRVNPRQKTGA
jgi:hypothetical protein